MSIKSKILNVDESAWCGLEHFSPTKLKYKLKITSSINHIIHRKQVKSCAFKWQKRKYKPRRLKKSTDDNSVTIISLTRKLGPVYWRWRMTSGLTTNCQRSIKKNRRIWWLDLPIWWNWKRTVNYVVMQLCMHMRRAYCHQPGRKPYSVTGLKKFLIEKLNTTYNNTILSDLGFEPRTSCSADLLATNRPTKLIISLQ